MRHADLTPGMTVHHATSDWDFRSAPGRVGTIVSTDRLVRVRGMFASGDYVDVLDGDGNTVRVPYVTRDPKGRYVAVRFPEGFRGGARDCVQVVNLAHLYTPQAAAARHEQEKVRLEASRAADARAREVLSRRRERLEALALGVDRFANPVQVIDALLDHIDDLSGTLTDPIG